MSPCSPYCNPFHSRPGSGYNRHISTQAPEGFSGKIDDGLKVRIIDLELGKERSRSAVPVIWQSPEKRVFCGAQIAASTFYDASTADFVAAAPGASGAADVGCTGKTDGHGEDGEELHVG